MNSTLQILKDSTPSILAICGLILGITVCVAPMDSSTRSTAMLAVTAAFSGAAGLAQPKFPSNNSQPLPDLKTINKAEGEVQKL